MAEKKGIQDLLGKRTLDATQEQDLRRQQQIQNQANTIEGMKQRILSLQTELMGATNIVAVLADRTLQLEKMAGLIKPVNEPKNSIMVTRKELTHSPPDTVTVEMTDEGHIRLHIKEDM